MKRSNKNKEELIEFFKDKLANHPNSCENCGKKFPRTLSIMNIAHILPKNRFKSVMTHPDNCMHLCNKCHHDFDSSWGKAMTMKVWDLAVKRFKKFEHLIKEKSFVLLNFKKYAKEQEK